MRFDVVAVTDASGAVVERRRFDDFGNVEFRDGAGAVVGASPSGLDYGFQGRRLDRESGLMYFRHRYYDPELGRFVQRDPVWDAGNVGGWYSFVGGGPAARLDPWGLTGVDPSSARGWNQSWNNAADAFFRAKDWVNYDRAIEQADFWAQFFPDEWVERQTSETSVWDDLLGSEALAAGVDVLIGVGTVLAEPVQIARDVAVGTPGGYTSMTFQGTEARLSAGESKLSAGLKLGFEFFVVANPISGPLVAVWEVGAGIASGDWQRVGRGIGILGLHLGPRLAARRAAGRSKASAGVAAEQPSLRITVEGAVEGRLPTGETVSQAPATFEGVANSEGGIVWTSPDAVSAVHVQNLLIALEQRGATPGTTTVIGGLHGGRSGVVEPFAEIDVASYKATQAGMKGATWIDAGVHTSQAKAAIGSGKGNIVAGWCYSSQTMGR